MEPNQAPPSGAPPLAPQQNLTEAQQEALLKAKYGGLLPKKKIAPRVRCKQLPAQDHKYFDSADWALSKQQGAANQTLQPKMEPSQFPPRRASQLGEGQP